MLLAGALLGGEWACGAVIGRVHAADEVVSRKPLKLMLGFAPGTGPDVYTRALASQLGAAWPGGVAVDNRPGAGGALGISATGVAAADGSHLLFATVGEMSIGPHFQERMAFDPAELVPVAQIYQGSVQFVVPASMGVASVAEWTSAVKGRDKLLIGTFGVGTPHHLAAVMIGSVLQRPVEPVHYRAPADMLADISAGRLDATLASSVLALSWSRAGKAKVLATSGTGRIALLPEVPTFAQVRLQDAEVPIWGGIFAPPGTPAELVTRMEAAVLVAAASPEYRDRLVEQGARVSVLRTAEFADLVRRDRERYGQVVSRFGLKSK